MKNTFINEPLIEIIEYYKKIYELTLQIGDDSEPESIWDIMKRRKEMLLKIKERSSCLSSVKKDNESEKETVSEKYSQINDIVKRISKLDEKVKNLISRKMKFIKSELTENNRRTRAAAAYTMNSNM